MRKDMIAEAYSSLTTGRVVARFVKGDMKIVACDTHNVIMNATADSLAQLYAGQARIYPSRRGFIYGSSANTGWTQNLSPALTYDGLISELSDHSANLQIVNFSFSPSLSSSDTSKYKTNVVSFHGHTDPDAEVAISDGVEMEDTSKIFGAVILDANTKPTLLNRVVLADSQDNPLVRPEGFELTLDWSINFSTPGSTLSSTPSTPSTPSTSQTSPTLPDITLPTGISGPFATAFVSGPSEP